MPKVNWPPEFYDLPPDKQEQVRRLHKTHGAEIARKAQARALLVPGREAAFLRKYFSHRLEAELEDFQVRLMNTALREQRGLILFPQGHGKTTLVSTLLPILELCRNPDIRIVILAKNDQEGDGIGSSIMTELADNEPLNRDFGPFRPEADDPQRPWRHGWFSIRSRTKISKEPNIAIFGSGAKNILGHRSDWVICDDVVTEKNSSTPDQRDNMRIWFETSVETSPEKKIAGVIAGRITVVGTMFHPHDLYYTIRTKTDSDGEFRYKFHREDAILDEANEKPLWPERWTWKDLMDEKTSMGTLSFNKRFRNKPVDESQQHFKEDWIKGRGKKGSSCLDWYRSAGEWHDGWMGFQGFDPAIGSSKNAKFCGQIVFGTPREQRDIRNLVLIRRSQMTLPQQVETIIDTHLAYPDMACSVIEINAYQRGLLQAVLDKTSERGITINVQPHTTGVNKLDPGIGIASLAPLVEQGKLRFPYGDKQSRAMSDLLIEEMIEYPFFAYSDLLMALWFANLKANIAVPLYKSFNRLQRAGSAWHRRANRNMIVNPAYATRYEALNNPLESISDEEAAAAAILSNRVGDVREKVDHYRNLDIDSP